MFFIIRHVIIRHFVIGLEILAPKLIDLKTALVHIEVYVARFKIGRQGLPNDSFRVQSFNRLLRAVIRHYGTMVHSLL